MIKRLISGICYIGIIVGFILLRDYEDERLFQILPMLFCGIGTFELVRALKDYIFKGFNYIAVIFGVLIIPQYAITEYFVHSGYGYLFSISFIALMIIITAITSAIKRVNFKAFIVNALPYIYPALFVLTMSLSSDLKEYGLDALLMIFIIPAAADTFAYLVGMIYNKIRKGNAKKLCPNLSPKKTVAGAIGGIIGGVITAIVIWLIRKTKIEEVSGILIFIIMGLVSSVLTEIGDLFESFIKRKVGIKDMGRIMPGHGGILDRIDGLMFSSVFIYITLAIV